MEARVVKKRLFRVRCLIIVLLLLGVFFRFVNLDRKLFWYDETVTAVRNAGYTRTEIVQQLFHGREIGVEDLQKYLRTNSQKGLLDTIHSLAVEDPQHPPLYYVIAQFWARWFGNSPAVARTLTALISLLVFPCVYWLCLELFNSHLTGGVATALLAISPFHVIYAQETRNYALWTVTIVLSSASLLRAMRLNTKLSWRMYAFTVALGLYSFLFSGLVMIGHGIYVITSESLQLSKKVTNYLFASLIGLLIFVPWLWVIVSGFARLRKATSHVTGVKVGKLSLLKTLLNNFAHVFLDLNFINIENAFISQKIMLLEEFLSIPLLIILGYSVYFLCRNSSKKVWLFVLALTVMPALCLLVPDLLFGGKVSTVHRYLIPCYLGIQLAVAYFIATQINSIYIYRTSNVWQRNLWQAAISGLVLAGVLSCTIISYAKMTRNRVLDYYSPQIVSIINQSSRPLLVSSTHQINTTVLLSFSYVLDPKVKLQLTIEPNIPQINNSFSDVFLFNTSEVFSSEIAKQQNFEIEPVKSIHKPLLWRLVKE